VNALIKKEGILVGGSSGAVMAATLKYASTVGRDKCIVAVFPDTGFKYLSKY